MFKEPVLINSNYVNNSAFRRLNLSLRTLSNRRFVCAVIRAVVIGGPVVETWTMLNVLEEHYSPGLRLWSGGAHECRTMTLFENLLNSVIERNASLFSTDFFHWFSCCGRKAYLKLAPSECRNQQCFTWAPVGKKCIKRKAATLHLINNIFYLATKCLLPELKGEACVVFNECRWFVWHDESVEHNWEILIYKRVGVEGDEERSTNLLPFKPPLDSLTAF